LILRKKGKKEENRGPKRRRGDAEGKKRTQKISESEIKRRIGV